MAEDSQASGSALMKIVETIAISPEDARVVVNQYRDQVRAAQPSASSDHVQKIVTDKIIQRYSKLAATSGGATSLAGVFPGVGTAISAIGGSMADISLCLKLQIDMTMCLAIAINDGLSNEDAKHMSFYVALSGSLEKLVSDATTKTASKAAVKIADGLLKNATLKVIKELFAKIGIVFTKKAALKAIPFGIGVVVGASVNYTISRYVGAVARDTFVIHKKSMGSFS